MSGRSAAVSLTTHVPLWHASPRSVRTSLERDGVRLVREYVWCGTLPILPIQFARAHIGDFVLTLLALPRDAQHADGFAWDRTRGASEGDAGERAYDHGGASGSWDEVKVWTSVPPEALQEVLTAEEVTRRIDPGGGRAHVTGSVFGRQVVAGGRTPYDRCLPARGAFPDFEEECRALLADPSAPPEPRIHAAYYLRAMGRSLDDALPAHGGATPRDALIGLLVAGEELADNVVAVATGLLARPMTNTSTARPWLPLAAMRAAEAPPHLGGATGRSREEHWTRLVAFASATHSTEQVAAPLKAAAGASAISGRAAQTIGLWLPRLVSSEGRDTAATEALAEEGTACAAALVAFALGAPHSNGVATGLVDVFARMPPDVGAPALVALLRRRRDVRAKARPGVERALGALLHQGAPGLEAAIVWVALRGRAYAREAARHLLERHGSPAARSQLQEQSQAATASSWSEHLMREPTSAYGARLKVPWDHPR